MIVVIDDDELMRHVAEEYLRMVFEDKWRVRAFPPDDFEHIDWEGTAVAVVDLMMPTPGTEILAWLKEHHPRIKRIAWSASAIELRDAEDLADTVISKVSLGALAQTVEQLRSRVV